MQMLILYLPFLEAKFEGRILKNQTKVISDEYTWLKAFVASAWRVKASF